MPNSEVGRLSADDRRHLTELDFDRSAVLLPPGCYLNHSCEPNAMRSGVKVFAWRAIRKGEEITIDYRLKAFGERAVAVRYLVQYIHRRGRPVKDVWLARLWHYSQQRAEPDLADWLSSQAATRAPEPLSSSC